MKKNELVTAVAKGAQISKAEAEAAISAMVDAIVSVGTNEDTLRLSGLGTFKGKVRPPRQARNPATGAYIAVPEKKVITFSMSKAVEL